MSRPIPDQNLVKRTYEAMCKLESPMQRYVREEWEAAIGATRVSLDAVRKLYPVEADYMSEGTVERLESAGTNLASVYAELDKCAGEILGDTMLEALHGGLTEEDVAAYERKAEAHVKGMDTPPWND